MHLVSALLFTLIGTTAPGASERIARRLRQDSFSKANAIVADDEQANVDDDASSALVRRACLL